VLVFLVTVVDLTIEAIFVATSGVVAAWAVVVVAIVHAVDLISGV